jgi:hypothetical protein
MLTYVQEQENEMSTNSPEVALYSRWETTALWQELLKKEGPNAEEARATIRICMKTIVQVLDKAGTSPKNFTLHDANHSFRVAERMAAIIPGDVLPELSVYELSLLLLSAFTHDIGMTPEWSRITLHYEFLLTNESSLLSEKERVEFQQWLDHQSAPSIAPAPVAKPTIAQLRQARELIAYYCRARHNEWSMAWIRSNLGQLPMGNYINWVEDLVQLCGSHHEGYKHLTAPRFDERLIAGQVVHMRYLACVLRVADVLEIDPERTPPVILRHRSIRNESVLHWHKDVTLTLAVQNDEILAYARPSNAYLHKAIIDALDGIDLELETAFLISIEHPFSRLTGSQARILPHKWVLPRKLTRNIAPRDGNYEYIDGAFRPDTSKLLELLSGVELYESKWAAVRELLQNAFDAVRIQIAWQRLNHTAPLDPAFIDSLRHIHVVKLTLEKITEDGQHSLWLVCSDTGVGMTKGIIENYLLVSGARRQPQILELARRCKAAGFDLDATGQFGIGVLSYFMIADKLEFRTVRSREAGDPVLESTGWRFESEGVGSFGELRKDDTLPKGTMVRLQLRSEFVGEDIAEARRKIEEFVLNLVRFVPCKFQYESAEFPDGEVACGPGWVWSIQSFRAAVLDQITKEQLFKGQELPTHLVPKLALQKQKERESYWKKIHSQIEQTLEIVTREDALPDGFGRIRIHAVFFNLHRGTSLVFFDSDTASGTELKELEFGGAFLTNNSATMSWKGMVISAQGRDGARRHRSEFNRYSSTFVEIDWTSNAAGRIFVNRNVFVPSDRANDLLSWVRKRVEQTWLEILERHSHSDFAFINYRTLDLDSETEIPCNWIYQELDRLELRAVRFPIVHNVEEEENDTEPDRLVFKSGYENPVTVLRDIETSTQDISFTGWSHAPDKVVTIASPDLQIVSLWTSAPRRSAILGFATSSFPKNWKHVCGSDTNGDNVWNREHPAVKVVTPTVWKWMQDHLTELKDPPGFETELTSDPARVAAWILRLLSLDSNELWEGIEDRYPQFMEKVWAAVSGLFPSGFKNQFVFVARDDASKIHVIDVLGWHIYEDEAAKAWLPDPDDEWILLEPDNMESDTK